MLFKRRRSRLANLVSSAEDMLNQISDVTTPHVRALKRELRSSLPGVKRQIRGYARRGIAGAREVGAVAAGRARQYPWLTLAIGAAVAAYAVNATLSSRRE